MAEEIMKNGIMPGAGQKGAQYIVEGDGSLDARFVVNTYATLTDSTAWQLTLKGQVVKTLPYVGLTTYAKDTQKLYVCTSVGTNDIFEGISWKEVGSEVDIPIKEIKFNGSTITPDTNGVVSIEHTVDTSNFVEKIEGKGLSTEDYTTEEKNKLTGLADFQSIADSDKVLTLDNGVLSSTIVFTKDTVEGKECLVVKGKDGALLGSVETSQFIADSFLDDVNIENGDINFTWKMADGSDKTDSVSLSDYIKPYSADETTITLNVDTNTFSVKDGVFITSEDLEPYALKTDIPTDLGEDNIIEAINIITENGQEATPLEIVNKAVTINLSSFDQRLDILEAVINPEGSDTNITELIAGKQDAIGEGSEDTPHVIWDNTNKKWIPGKISIPEIPENRLVPETTDVVSPAILAFNGTDIIWSSSEVQTELPEYNLDNKGQILTVSETEVDGQLVANLIWTSAPNSTTITNTLDTDNTTVLSSTISNGSEEVTVYSKDGVDKLLSWQELI